MAIWRYSSTILIVVRIFLGLLRYFEIVLVVVDEWLPRERKGERRGGRKDSNISVRPQSINGTLRKNQGLDWIKCSGEESESTDYILLLHAICITHFMELLLVCYALSSGFSIMIWSLTQPSAAVANPVPVFFPLPAHDTRTTFTDQPLLRPNAPRIDIILFVPYKLYSSCFSSEFGR